MSATLLQEVLRGILRLKGKDIDKNFGSDGTLSKILSNGSLNFKVILTSGEENTKKIDKLGNAVLGYGWDPKEDTIKIISCNVDVPSFSSGLPSSLLLHA